MPMIMMMVTRDDDTPESNPPQSGRNHLPSRKTGQAGKRRSSLPTDPWEGWKPDWHGSHSPHAQQEKHAATQAVRLRSPATAGTNARSEEISCQRRIVDARLWDAMTPHQQQAAMSISMAFETMGKGLGFATSDWKRIPGARGVSNIGEAHGRLINSYIEWTKACHKEGVSHSMVVDVLVFGFPCRIIDRDRRVRAGTTRQNLIEGLSLYCKIRGWPAE